MKIGVRKSPHLETVLQGIAAVGDVTLTSAYDTGADFYLCWGWPQAEQIARDVGRDADIICVDAHPFALRAGDRTGARIFQLGNWGALARYPKSQDLEPVPTENACKGGYDPGGPVLVLGHVSSTEQQRGGLIDVWYTPGGDAWLAQELAQPERKFRPHPRMWKGSTPQATLAADLRGCSLAVAWNSTAAVHAQMLGFPSYCVEAHGWAHMELEELGALRVTQAQLRSGEYWATIYRPWLETLGR